MHIAPKDRQVSDIGVVQRKGLHIDLLFRVYDVLHIRCVFSDLLGRTRVSMLPICQGRWGGRRGIPTLLGPWCYVLLVAKIASLFVVRTSSLLLSGIPVRVQRKLSQDRFKFP